MSNEIVEDDIRAKQSLQLFKNWLAKHPFLRYTGDDDIDDLLMACLRIKKFSMQKVYESFEFTVPFIKLHPDWYSNPTSADYEFTKMPNSPLIFLKNLDGEGRRVHIQKLCNFNDMDETETFRKILLTTLLAVFDINAQINGAVVVLDYRDISVGRWMNVPIHLIQDSIKSSKSGLAKLKQINIIGMPSYFKTIFEIAKHFTSAKMLQRMNFINDVEELSQYMDVSVLPKEYGGSSDELLDYEIFENGINYVNKILKFDVNFSNIQEYQNEDFGSFRKLEID